MSKEFMFRNDDFMLELLPQLVVRVSSKSKITLLRFSEWELKRYWERIVSAVMPINIQVAASDRISDIRLIFATKEDLLLYKDTIMKLTHIIEDTHVLVDIVRPNREIPFHNSLWEKSRSIWIKNAPCKLFKLDPLVAVVPKGHLLWDMFSDDTTDIIERIEVASPISGSNDIGIALTKNICIRFISFKKCMHAMSLLSGAGVLSHNSELEVGEGEVYSMQLVARHIHQGETPNLHSRLYILRVEPDESGYLRKQAIHHREHLCRREARALATFRSELDMACHDLESIRTTIEQREVWASEAEGSVQLKKLVTDAFLTVDRQQKTLGQLSPGDCNIDILSAVDRLSRELKTIMTAVTTASESFVALADAAAVKDKEARDAQEKERKLKESESVHAAARVIARERDQELLEIDKILAQSCENICLYEDSDREACLQWRQMRAVIVGVALKPSRSLHSAMNKLIFKWDTCSSESDRDRLTSSLRDCLKMSAAETAKVAPLLRVWRELSDIQELLCDIKTAVNSQHETVVCSTSGPILASVSHVASRGLQLLHAQLVPEGTLPSEHLLDGLRRLYPLLCAVIGPVKSHLLATETLLERTKQFVAGAIAAVSVKTEKGQKECGSTVVPGQRVSASVIEIVQQAIHQTEYRLARMTPLVRQLLQPKEPSASPLSTAAADSELVGAFSNTCAVSGVELRSAWEWVERSYLHHEDSIAAVMRREEKEAAEARGKDWRRMVLEDERSDVLRTVENLRGRQKALLHVIDKRQVVEEGAVRKRKRRRGDTSADGPSDRWMLARDEGGHCGAGGVRVRVPVWRTTEDCAMERPSQRAKSGPKLKSVLVVPSTSADMEDCRYMSSEAGAEEGGDDGGGDVGMTLQGLRERALRETLLRTYRHKY